jgi:hypothetical protein
MNVESASKGSERLLHEAILSQNLQPYQPWHKQLLRIVFRQYLQRFSSKVWITSAMLLLVLKFTASSNGFWQTVHGFSSSH